MSQSVQMPSIKVHGIPWLDVVCGELLVFKVSNIWHDLVIRQLLFCVIRLRGSWSSVVDDSMFVVVSFEMFFMMVEVQEGLIA